MNVWEYCTYLCLPYFFFGHLATIELSHFFTLIRQEHLCNHTYVLVGFVVLCASAVRLESVIFWDSLYFCRFLCIYIYISMNGLIPLYELEEHLNCFLGFIVLIIASVTHNIT